MRIQLIGEPRIVGDDGEERPVRGQQAWAVLARVLLADRPLPRRQLSAELFPAAEDPLGALRWCLAGLRRALDLPDALAGDPLGLDLPGHVTADVLDLLAGDLDPRGAGQLLEGVTPRCGADFEIWLLVERSRIDALLDDAIRDAVLVASSAGDRDRALELAELGAARRPLDEGAQLLLVSALRDAGRHGAARSLVEQVEQRFLAETGVPPSPALRSAARPGIADPPPGVTPASLAASQLEAGAAALDAGAAAAGIESLRQACVGADRSGDRRLRARCLLGLGSALVHAVRSHDDEGALLLQRAADLAETVDDRGTAVAARRELGYLDALAGRRPAAERHLEAARVLADGDASALAGVVAVSAWNRFDRGDEAAGIDEFGLALELARSAAEDRQAAWTLGLGAWAHLRHGDPATATAWSGECEALAQDVRWLAFLPWPRAVGAEAALADGGAGTSVRDGLTETFALARTLADPCWEGAAARTLACAEASTGDVAAALDWLDAARASCTRETDVFVTLHAAVLETEAAICAAAGLDERAEAAHRALAVLAARTHMDVFLGRAVAALGAPGAPGA